MKTLQRPPIFTFRDISQIAYEWGRIFELPHDVLYDFKLLLQIEEDWVGTPIVEVKTTRDHPWHISIRFKSKPDIDLTSEGDVVTAALTNEFGEVVGFKDICVLFLQGNIFKTLTYTLDINHDCQHAQQFSYGRD